MKRFLIAILSIFLIVMSIPTDTSAKAKDDITGHYAEADMRALIEKGILEGTGNGLYKPENAVTRAAFAKLVVQTLELHPPETVQLSLAEMNDELFTDVPEGAWYHPYVYAAVKAGIVKGYPNNLFKPSENITREQMAEMISRALDSRGIVSEVEGNPINFADKNQINKYFKEAVERIASLGIMMGNPDNRFSPKSDATRGQAAIVLNRAITILSGGEITPPSKYEYKIATLDANWKPTIISQHETFAQAKKVVKANQVVLQEKVNKEGQVFYHDIYIKSGVAVASKFTTIYDSTSLKAHHTYAGTGTELKYVDATENYVKIEISNKVGYVSPEDVKLIPEALKKGQSYFENKSGELYHQVYNPLTNTYAQVHPGKAPSFMKQGQKYYSWDGIEFTTASGAKAGTAYQYFNYMPLHASTNYTAGELDKFLKEQYPSTYQQKIKDSPLAGIGKSLKQLEEKYEVNALYLMANAIHESAWGTSAIAQDKKNLFGIDAGDSDPNKTPYEKARTFKSFADCLEFMAKELVANEYHNPKNWKYNGAVLGNKALGMNVRYASDPYWGEKIAGHMYRADTYLGKKDFAKQQLATTNVANLNVRPGYGTNSGVAILSIPTIGTPIIYTEKKTQDGATWYKIRTDDKNNRVGHVYGNGSLGQYVKEMPIMK